MCVRIFLSEDDAWDFIESCRGDGCVYWFEWDERDDEEVCVVFKEVNYV